MTTNTPPRKKLNKDSRPREYLTKPEIELLRKAARSYSKRLALRDELFIFLMFRHALRVSELVELTWEQFNFEEMTFYPRRKKGGINTPHPMDKAEISLLKRYKKKFGEGKYIFNSQKGGILATRTVAEKIKLLGREAGLEKLNVHAHMLRHGAGFYLVSQGYNMRWIQAYMGHKSISSTMIYTQVTQDAFENFKWL